MKRNSLKIRCMIWLTLVVPMCAGTRIVDTLKYRVVDPSTQSNLANCVIYIADNTPSSDTTTTYVPFMLRYPVINGVVDLTLEPNDSSSPTGTSYSVRYSCSKDLGPPPEVWVVPSGGPFTIREVRAAQAPTPSVLISPSQLSSAGAKPGQSLVWNGASWSPQTSTGGSPGGDLSGMLENAKVSGIQGRPVAPAVPLPGQVMRWDNATGQWLPSSLQYTATFTRAKSVTVPSGFHQLKSSEISVTCFDANTPARIVEPDGWTISPTSNDVTITFSVPQDGRCMLH